MANKKKEFKSVLVGITLHPDVAKMLRDFSEKTGIPASRLVSDWILTHCKPEGKDA